MPRLDSERASLLQYVRVPSSGAELEGFPDFLIVGPQRTGTSWLHRNVERHPEIFMATPKELFYFNLLDHPLYPRYQSSDLEWYLSFFRENEVDLLRKQKRALLDHGLPYAPRVRGEATAGYAAMAPHLIREVTILNPHIKVILTVRNPVERAWSHAKLDLTKDMGRSIGLVTDQEFRDFFKSPYQIKCGQYLRQISNWRSFLEPGALMIGLFDDILENPERFLQRVFRFLGVRDDIALPSDSVRRRVAESESIAIPTQYQKMLTKIFRRELAEWKDLLRLYRNEDS